MGKVSMSVWSFVFSVVSLFLGVSAFYYSHTTSTETSRVLSRISERVEVISEHNGRHMDRVWEYLTSSRIPETCNSSNSIKETPLINQLKNQPMKKTR